MADAHGEIEEIARELYSRIGNIPCPKFGGEKVAFNRVGFRHLIWKRGAPRPEGERQRRFALLRHASGMVLNPRANVIQRIRGRAKFWMFQEERDDRTIKLIVRQLKGGNKHFYSIFADKKKPSSD